ncbi:MAG: hypothetical protein ACJ0QK_01780 [Flavobacteriales bacterium]
MKTKIITALIFFTSCADIPLKFPQPVYLENIEKIPSNFQGSFERIDDKDTIKYKLFETFGLIDNDSLKLGSDQLIVKYQNNNLFVNLKSDGYYNLYVLSRFNYFEADSVLIKSFSFNNSKNHHDSNDDAYILNYMNINKFSFAEFPKDIPEDLKINLFGDTLNVNQINTLLNWDRYAYRLKFNKH